MITFPDEVFILFEKFNRFSKGSGECLEWTYSFSTHRYGAFKFKGKEFLAHRIAYYLAYGPYDKRLFVLHKCDNRPCVEPKHLFLGTHKDNMDDKVQKKRHTKGEDVWISKFDKETAKYIRELYSTNRYSMRELAKMFDVHHATIWHLLQRNTWKDD